MSKNARIAAGKRGNVRSKASKAELSAKRNATHGKNIRMRRFAGENSALVREVTGAHGARGGIRI